jgi:CubicO group peptidase (beta-lactamase class C family)
VIPPLLILQTGIDSGLHLGAQIVVVHRGQTVLNESVGDVAPGQTMSRDNHLLWMSAGKPLATIAMLQLIERDLISLDTRVADIIPAFGANGKDAITLRHILLHTAGFRGPLNNFTPGTWDEIIARVCALRQEPSWIPGQKAGYHIGSSWFILGELVRLLDGRDYSAYVREEIFNRLSVPGSVGTDATDLPKMFVTEKSPPTDHWPGNAPGIHHVARPGANARGPIASLAAVYDSLLHDDRLLTAPSRLLMRSRLREGMFDETFKKTLDWGLGVMLDSKRYAGPHPYGYGRHASDQSFGHSGNQCSCAFADPAHDLVIAWCCNGLPGEETHQQRAAQINEAVYEWLGIAHA